MRDYEDFELWISADGEGGGYRVRAAGAGESQRVELDVEALAERVKGLAEAFEGGGPVGPEGLREAKAVGKALFEAILPRSIFGRWSELRTTRWGFGRRDLRLRLHFERAVALAALPWELLHDGQRFLCQSDETPVVHGPEFLGSVEHGAVKPPFRVLAVLPEPLRQLNLDTYSEFLEIQKQLEPVIGNGTVAVELLEKPTFRGLLERLKADPPVHALHFAGHGEALPEYGDGRLWFQQDGRIRNADPISGSALAPILCDAKIKFVFINACEGGRTGTFEEPMSLAHRLLEAGVPAVLALRTPIGDRAAKEFSRTFYHLLAKCRSLEESVAAGRQALQPGAFGLAWASPVLYLRAPTGQVIRHKTWIFRTLLFAPILIAAVFGIALAFREGKRIVGDFTKKTPRIEFPKPTSNPACPSPPGVELAFRLIRPREFYMGEEKPIEVAPIHRVQFTKPVCIGAYEITETQWDALSTGGSTETRQGKDFPKVRVSWSEIARLFERLNEREPGANYRLLTEAEWEYVARAGGTAKFSFGDDSKDLMTFGNCIGDEDGYSKLAPIGSFPPNRFGLYDLHGNAQEWVADWFDLYPQDAKLLVDPKGPEIGTERVRRGGSFDSSAASCAAWSRAHSEPGRHQYDVGFRIARSPK